METTRTQDTLAQDHPALTAALRKTLEVIDQGEAELHVYGAIAKAIGPLEGGNAYHHARYMFICDAVEKAAGRNKDNLHPDLGRADVVKALELAEKEPSHD